jgi:AraC-like DNA-binding protein
MLEGPVQRSPSQFPLLPIETLHFRGECVGIGTLRCAPDHPLFADSGPVTTHCFAFPRSAVLIAREHHRPLVEDATLVSFYNRSERYRRRAVSRRGDVADWFAIEPAVLIEAVAEFDPAVRDQPGRPFRVPATAIDSPTFLLQRSLVERVQRDPTLDTAYVDERALALLDRVLTQAYGPLRLPREGAGRAREIVELTKEVLARTFTQNLPLTQIARYVDASPFYLCRVFRMRTGTTIHDARNRLRLRRSLEALAETAQDLLSISLGLGYSSHSHFTAAFRREFGMTPSAFRRSIVSAP